MAIPTITVRPGDAASAYRRVDAGDFSTGAPANSFAATLREAVAGVVASGEKAEAQSLAALSGHADLTDVVAAVSKAELALQTTVAIRDRVVQAYQDIIKMPI